MSSIQEKVETKPCGCQTFIKCSGNMVLEQVKLCEEHRTESRKKEQEVQNNRMEYTEAIRCDNCDGFLCYAYSGGDLNCNYFYCDDCVINHCNKRGEEATNNCDDGIKNFCI